MTARTRRSRAALCLLLSGCLVACGDAADAGSPGRGPAAIPRQRLVNPAEWPAVANMNYDPADAPLAFTPSGELLVAHMARYSSHDVYSGVCAGSGFYAVPLAGGPPRPLALGRRACRAVSIDDGMAANADATSVVFSESVPPNNSRLARLNLSTGRVDTLATACQVYLQDPAVSPDGRTITATGLCRGRDQESFALYTLRADGSGLREVLYDAGSAAWSPDGRWLAATQGERIVVLTPDGRNLRAVTTGDGAAWSPDGRWIAFFDEIGDRRRGRHGIFIVRPDGSGRRMVFQNAVLSTYSRGWGPNREGEPESRLVWSPDSRWIVFSRRFDSGTLVWRVDVHTGRLEQVTRAAR